MKPEHKKEIDETASILFKKYSKLGGGLTPICQELAKAKWLIRIQVKVISNQRANLSEKVKSSKVSKLFSKLYPQNSIK